MVQGIKQFEVRGVSKPIVFGEHKKCEQKDIENKKYPQNSRVLIIDGDTLAFRVASGHQKAFITVKSPSGRTMKFKNRKEWKKFQQDRELAYTGGYEIVDGLLVEELPFCLGALKRKFEALVRDSFATHVEIYFGGHGNFRLDLPLIEKYKGQRSKLKPVHLEECQKYMVEKLKCIEVIGVETDDVVQQRVVSVAKQGSHPILATIDKDAYQVFDNLEYSIMRLEDNTFETIKGGFGEIHLNEKGELKGSGFIWLMSQIFLFDMTDNYKLNSFYEKRYGQKTFYKDFKDCIDEKQLLNLMIKKWNELLPKTIKYRSHNGVDLTLNRLELIELYFSCAYMRLVADDPQTFENILIKYGVDYSLLEVGDE